ncbi:uncharacterized protein BT62DRAFT_688057 [Guyanagaster necrorhizus]|uniref:Uncharacterized protein n=1 Tax=Guyanagaster necrorhizus TaxID=856835 RepID=A0A9P7VFV8_9AGAR|nr:uncharacterized protein BT62DRAFT_688057 [Guyanagaster necrorhizus MCA 3950]KAG7439795.1 hypothetical protein BT62DRAFT_688057 [Guyanagaster necrorhizus MCA 3950]
MFVMSAMSSMFFLFSLLSLFFTGTEAAAVSAIPTLSYKFTLAALNTSLPNTNDTGVPLVLGQNGATDGMTFEVTSTYASYPYNDYPYISLNGGSLKAYRSSGISITNATTVQSGGELEWATSSFYSATPGTSYSAVTPPSGKYAVLAVFGNVDMWSLCPSRAFRGQNNVIYNVSTVASPYASYIPSDCCKVTLNIVPL